MAEFRGAGVVAVAVPTSAVEFVPVPSSPEMVLWALPGPTGDIPYADVENLVDAEFTDRIATMTQLESDTEAHASAASGSAGDAASSASAAATSASDAGTSASEAASSASTAADEAATATTYANSAYSHSQDASTHSTTAGDYAADAEQWATSFDLTVGPTDTAAPGSSASVTVTGDGPEYALSFSIPEGVKGAKGDPGEVSQADLDAAVASLVDSSPGALDTLGELASALGDDPNFATTVSNQIASKADSGHTHDDRYYTKSQANDQYVGAAGNSTKTGNLIMDGGSVAYRRPDTSGGWARGFWWNNPDDSRIGGIGVQGSGDSVRYFYIGHGESPWSGAIFSATETEVDINGDLNVSGSTNLTASDVGAAEASHTHTKGEVGLGNVDNTADADKPVSTAQQQALDAKIQLVTEFPSSPESGVLYLKADD